MHGSMHAPLDRLLAAHCYELGVAQVVVWGPFEEFKAPNKQGPEPDAVFHLLGGETFAPTTAPGFGQIRERALRDFQSLELPEQPVTRRRRKTVAGSRHIHE